MTEKKVNKTYEIVKALQQDGELYDKYIKREISKQEIADMYGVTYQHVTNIVKENNIDNPKEKELQHIKNDINNALPIEYFKDDYSLFKNITTTMSMFKSLTSRIRTGELDTKLPLLTNYRIKDVLITEINILKEIEKNNDKPRGKKKRIIDIAKEFDVSYTKVATISSYHKKYYPNSLLPNKDDELVKVVMRNMDIVDKVTHSELEHSEAIENIVKEYDIPKEMVIRILSCEAYNNN